MSETAPIPKLNLDVARHLDEKARELETNGKNKFRVIAFKKAAAAVRSEPRNLWGVYRSGGIKGLEKIKGVGHRIAWDIVNQIQVPGGKTKK